MTPTPEQLQAWREEAHWLYLKDTSVDFDTEREFVYEAGYLRARTEQATEIAELKDYKKWYEEAISASNVAGYAGVSATQTIEHQDSEIAELKAKLEQVMPLAKFGVKILKTKALFDVEAETFALSLGLIEWLGSSLADPAIKPNIEATIEQLLKD